MSYMTSTATTLESPSRRAPGNRFPRTRSFSVDLLRCSPEGFSPGHEYVRRFWAAVIGRGATRDLLDLFLAGLRHRTVQEPFYLNVLLSAGLVRVLGDRILMPDRVPPLPSVMLARLNPRLRSDHRRWER